MKIKTIEKLQNKLNADLAWRKKELTTIYFCLKNAEGKDEEVLGRSGIAILYAHWEGFIKSSSQYYLLYISSQKINVSSLKENFLCLKLTALNKKTTYMENLCLIKKADINSKSEFYLSEEKIETLIKAESNLKETVLVNIFQMLGLDYPDEFQTKKGIIDTKLLNYRNHIVHGDKTEGLFDAKQAFFELKEVVLKLMDHFRDLIEEYSGKNKYKI
jgi:hypothetical protein